jgi:cyclase
MKRVRIIPVLTISSNKLVKTVQFKKPNYLGDPLNAIKIFNDKMVDELIILDIDASKQNKEPNYQLIEEMAGEAFMPLGYGGGIKTFEQASKVFNLGVEKIVLNSVLQTNINLITEIASVYGNQSVVISADIRKNIFGKNVLTYISGEKKSKENIKNLLNTFIQAGAGELIINNIEREGTFKGYDLDLIKEFSDLEVPIVVLGGCSGLNDMKMALKSGANAIAASSVFVYRNNNVDSILINYFTFNC